jgi:hypothetical protein
MSELLGYFAFWIPLAYSRTLASAFADLSSLTGFSAVQFGIFTHLASASRPKEIPIFKG